MVPISNEECSLGRMCILKEYRGQGYANLLVRALETYAISQNINLVSLHAQKMAVPFYQRAGYVVTHSEEFLEEGIWHLHMEKKLF
jgi:predicted GNAT family N-acyltransferase